jgi:hypothetical protein
MSVRRFAAAIACVVIGVTLSHRGSAAENDTGQIRDQFIARYCFSCHGAEQTMNEFRIDTLGFNLEDSETLSSWKRVFEYVESGLMPPQDTAKSPHDPERAEFLSSLEAKLNRAGPQTGEAGTPLRRLNRIEYLNTLRDLFGFRQIELPNTFPEDSTNLDFDTMPAGLYLSPAHLSAYVDAATDVADRLLPLPNRPTIRSFRDTKKVANDGSNYWQRSKDPAALGFTGVNISGHAGAYWDATFKAHLCGVYRVRLQVSAEAAQGADGRPLRLGFYAFDPSQYAVPPRALRVDLPKVREVEVTNRELEFVDCDVPLEQGETFHVYCENRFPIGCYPDRGVNVGAMNELTSAAKKADAPTIRFESMLIEGPTAPLPRQVEFLGNVAPSSNEQYLRARLLPLAERAFRQPLDSVTERDLIGSVQKHLERAADPVFGLHYGVRRILCSPKFLYRETRAGVLDDYALASRLSYFLWSSLPDAELLQLAADHRLSQEEALRGQVLRMIADKKSDEFVKHFTGQWLGNRKTASVMVCDNRYQWSELVRYGFIRSTEMFFDDVLRENLSIQTFIDSDFTYANEPMRLVWGFDVGETMKNLETNARQSATWPEPTRLDLTSLGPETPPGVASRSGVLGLSSVLIATSDGVESSPIRRGVWILENLFGTPPPPPPPNVPAIDIDTRGATTVRELLSAHQQAASCAICHRRIDPLGLALENYDAIGGWRDAYASSNEQATDGKSASLATSAIDTHVVLFDGTPLQGVQDIKRYLLQNRILFTRCLAIKLLEYAAGREINAGDERSLGAIIDREPSEGYRFQDFLVAIVTSEAFQTK